MRRLQYELIPERVRARYRRLVAHAQARRGTAKQRERAPDPAIPEHLRGLAHESGGDRRWVRCVGHAMHVPTSAPVHTFAPTRASMTPLAAVALVLMLLIGLGAIAAERQREQSQGMAAQ